MRRLLRIQKYLVILHIFSLSVCLLPVYAGAPHLVSGTLKYADDTSPAFVSFTACLLRRPGEVLNELSYGCGYSESVWTVQCGTLPSSWLVGDILHVDFDDGKGKAGSVEIFLTSEEADPAGVCVLTSSTFLYHDIEISMPDMTVSQGTTLNLPVYISGLAPQDSVVAYQIKIGFEEEVVQAVGALSEGTMTEMWGDPFFYSYEGFLGVGGMTTNQPSKRLIPDGGILCYLSLLVQGTPTEPSSASTLLSFFDAVVFTLEERIPVAHTGTGLVTVQENSSVVDVQIPLYPGENMVCLSVVPETPALPDILHSHPVCYVFGFQSDQTPPKSWVKDRPINDLESLDGIHGYWMKLDSSDAVTWEVTGTPVSVSTPVPVYRGWNLIGYFPSLSDSIAHAFQTISPYYNYILGYQGGEGPRSWVREKPDFLNDLFLLSPRSGYWVRMDSAATLVYPSGGYPASKSPADFPDTIEQDESSGVYITPWWCDFWTIQPEWLSPGDRIEVFDSDSVLCGETRVKEEGGLLVHVFGDDPSTAAIDEGAEAGETMRFVVNEMETEVVDGDPVWANRGSKCVQLEPVSSGIPLDSKSHLPKRVLLNQNYPNPFNSRTVIPCFLPLPSKVDIHIYDVSGRMVRILVDNESKQAGRFEVVWDGKDDRNRVVASGIYFCQLRIDHVKHIRKLIFME